MSRYLSMLCALVCLVLAGCAAQTAYREGADLAVQGQKEQALSKFEEAARMDSRSGRYRIAAVTMRESLVNDALAEGEQALGAGRVTDARAAFERALALHPGNPRARDGIKRIDVQVRHAKWMETAQDLVTKKDDKGALTLLRSLLAEDPVNARAGNLVELIEARKAPPAAATGGSLGEAYRKSISIEFRDAPLKTVFEVISRTSGLNFLFDKDVRTDQKTSIFLKNSSIEAAVNMTLLANQLEQRVLDANSVLIYPNTQAKQKDYQPLSVRTFYLANAEAKNVTTTLKTILKARDVVFDEKLNMVIVRDTPEALRLAEKLVALHDVPEPEVMLEVEVLEVKRTRLFDLGVRWPDQLSLMPLPRDGGGTLTLADLRYLNRSHIGATIGPTSIIANKTDSDANILANPRIRARNREKAKILIGERLPNITTTSTATGFVSESIAYVDVGLKLDVEPVIFPDGEVAIKVALEVSNVVNQIQTKSGAVAYQIGTRTAQTVLRLKDGENQVLAGLISDEDRRTAHKVPGLGEVPVVGRLFGHQADDGIKTEIVLSITPRVVRNIGRPGAALIEFESGTETSLGGRGTGAASSGEGANATPASPAGNTPATSAAPASPAAPQNSGLLGSSATGGFLGSPNTGAAAGSAQLQWAGPASVKVGESVTARLQLQTDQPIVSLPLAIGFDPKVLQVTAINEGAFLRQNNGQTSFTSRVDPSGQILVTATRAGDTGASSTGEVVSVTFRAVAPAPTPTAVQLLTISPIALGGRGVNAPMPAPLSITVTP